MKNKLIVGSLLCVCLLIAGIHLTTNDIEFSRDNAGWNGTSAFFSHLDRYSTEMIADISLLAGRENTTLLIIAPSGSYDSAEVRIIREYLQAGNTLILADESGTGEELLKGLESRITIGSHPLASIDRAFNDSLIIVASPVAMHPLTMQVQSLVLDKATFLTGGEPLIQSGVMSWIDQNGDSRISSDESFGRQSVLSREQFGEGEIIVLSDASIFINAMDISDSEWNNQQFLSNIVRYRPLLVEQNHSRTAETGIIAKMATIIRSDPFFKAGPVTLVLFLIAILIRKRPPQAVASFIKPMKM